MSACWTAAHTVAAGHAAVFAVAAFAMGAAMAAVAVVMIFEAHELRHLGRRGFAHGRLTGHPEQDREIIRSALPGGFVEPVLFVRPPLFVRLALMARAALAPRKGSRR